MYDIQLGAMTIFALATGIILLIYACGRKRKAPWLMFAMLAFILGSFAPLKYTGLAVFRTGTEWTSLELFTILPFIWIFALILLAKASSEEHMETQLQRQRIQNEIAKAHLKAKSIDEMTDSILASIATMYMADGGLIFVIDRGERKFEIVATNGKVPEEYAQFVKGLNATFDESVNMMDEWHMRDKFDVRRSYAASQEQFKVGGFKSIGIGTLRTGEEMIGLLVIYSKRSLGLTHEDDDFLNLIGFELGLWMEQKTNVLRIERMSRTQKGLLDISLALQQEITSEDISRLIVERLVALVPSRDAILFLYDKNKKLLWPGYATGKDSEAIMEEGEFPVAEAGIAGSIIKSMKGEIIHDSLRDGRGKQIEGTERESTAMLAVPLISKGQPIGIVELHRDLPETFTREELEIAALFAQQAAIITENSQLLGEMESEKDKSKLYLDLLSHDIANLNTPLYSYFDMMLNDPKVEESSKQILRKAYAQVEKISSLLMRVRKLSKAELEKLEEKKIVDPSAMIKEAVLSLRRAFPSKDIDIDVKDLEPKVLVNAGEMLDEVFFNVLHNAVKFSGGKVPRIEVTLEEMEIQGKWFCAVRFCDNGIGISDEKKPHVFTKPKAAAASFARGFGIGLNTCKKFVEDWGGSIWVEDRVRNKPTEGACFVVTLPIALKETHAGSAKSRTVKKST